MKSAALYIHIPFCSKKCDYCDFYSSTDLEQVDQYLEQVPYQIQELKQQYDIDSFSTLYFGGGTPGLMPLNPMRSLLEKIYHLNHNALPGEVTLECNPVNVRKESLSAWKDMGINRISLGVQSFQDQYLQKAGRHSNSELIRKALYLLRESNAFNLNIDLIQGLPAMTQAEQLDDLQEAIKWQSDHISWYSLILEEETPLYQNWDIQNEKIETDSENIWKEGCSLLKSRGYNRYEVSNFSKTGKESRHNMMYWEMKPYLSCGPSSVSMLSDDKSRVLRFKTKADISLYQKEAFQYDKEIIENLEFMKDFFLMGLRIEKGIEKKRFKKIFAMDMEECIPQNLIKGQREDLLISDDKSLRTTSKGMDLLNSILISIFDELDQISLPLKLYWPSD